jgi:hypothetical protein
LTSPFRGPIVVWPAPVVGLIVGSASLLIGPKRGDIRVDVAMASMAAFLFGVLLAFTIVRTRERLALVQGLVAKGNSSLFSIHQTMAVFGDQERRLIRALIDIHLTDQIDYRLVDYHLASRSFVELVEALYALDPVTRQEEVVYKELVGLGIEMTTNRSLIESSVGQAMSPLEWTGLSLLLLLLLGLIAVLPGGTVLGALAAAVLAGTLTTLMILLRKLDLLRWHERVTIWEPTTRLFRAMGHHPYVPRLVIDDDRYRPTGLIRVVDYPDAYPNRATKIVTVEDLGGGEEVPSWLTVTRDPPVPRAPVSGGRRPGSLRRGPELSRAGDDRSRRGRR